MTDPLILAIDQGTTGTTVLLFDREATLRGRGYAEFPQHYPRPGWVEHDAEEIWQTTLSVTQAALTAAGAAPGQVRAVGITNQRETCLLWDRATSAPLGPAIVWQDRRTAARCDRLREEGLEADWRARTGLVIDPYFSATKLQWMLEHNPDTRSRAADGELAFGTIDSWLVWRLSGGREHITDVTNASRTLLFNMRTLDWDARILSRLGIPACLLPKVVPSSGVCATTCPSAFLGIDAPIAGIAGDQQAALFGQACYHPGMLKNTYGTGSFLLTATGSTPVLSRERLLTTVAWKLGDAPATYALEGSVFVTGAAIQWLRDELGILDRAADSEALALSIDTNGDVYFVPALTGLGAPFWDPYARGTLIGLTRGTGRAHIVRAALESIAYQTRDVVAAMERDSGMTLERLRADGGAVGNRFLMQFQADLLGVPVDVPAITETTALGAASLAGLGVGIWNSLDDLAAHWHCACSYEPAMGQDERDALYERWLAAVQRSRGWARR